MVELRPMQVRDVQLLALWDQDSHVASALGGPAADWYDWPVEIARSVSWRELLIITQDALPLGFVQLLDAHRDESHYWGDVEPSTWSLDIWIGSPQDRGRGVGRAAMDVALHRLFDEHGAESVVIDPLVTNQRAVAFYGRRGFRTVGQRRLGDDDCLVMCMSQADWHGSGQSSST